MSNMFLGTALSKPNQESPTSKGGQEQPDQQQKDQQEKKVKEVFTLEELDRTSNCPESVDLDSWRLTCSLRRRKIDSKESIVAAAAELAETEEVRKSFIFI